MQFSEYQSMQEAKQFLHVMECLSLVNGSGLDEAFKLTRYKGAYILKDTSKAPAVTCSVESVHDGLHVCPIS